VSLNISIKTIPHKKQRYDTLGDYWQDGKVFKMRVSKLKDWRWEFLIAIHELVESHITRHRGIKEKDISEFDLMMLKKPESKYYLDPGCDPKAPYHKEHMFGIRIEKLLAKELDVNFKEYDSSIMQIGEDR
jgi:hypothetical protein